MTIEKEKLLAVVRALLRLRRRSEQVLDRARQRRGLEVRCACEVDRDCSSSALKIEAQVWLTRRAEILAQLRSAGLEMEHVQWRSSPETNPFLLLEPLRSAVNQILDLRIDVQAKS